MSHNPFSSLVKEETEQMRQLSLEENGTLMNPTIQNDNQNQPPHFGSSLDQCSNNVTLPRNTQKGQLNTFTNFNNSVDLESVNSMGNGLHHSPLHAPNEISQNYVYNDRRNSTTSRSSLQNVESPTVGNSAAAVESPSIGTSYVPVRKYTRSDSFKKVSNLDPGSVSTVSDKQFFGESANSLLPSRNRSGSKSSQSSNRRRFSNSSSSSNFNHRRNSLNNSLTHKKTLEFPQIQSPTPEIFVTDVDIAADSGPPLPTRPQLPPRPELHMRNSSASELLQNYSRNSYSDTQSSTSASNNVLTDDLLSGIDNFEGVVITDEMIKQQKEIEESIRRRKQERDSSNSFYETSGEANQSNNIDSISVDNGDNISIDSSNADDLSSRDTSQLEIPNSLSRSTSANSSESEAESSVISIDMFATGDITEEEFISLLPPVPAYTKMAHETELSIPDGKAIDILQINENHPQEAPPDYTPLTRAMKHHIRRPQFSQTGGDTQTYSRRQQQQLQQIESRMQQQEHMSAYHDRPTTAEDSPEERTRNHFDAPPLPLRPLFYGSRGVLLSDRNPRVRRVYPLRNLSSNVYRRYRNISTSLNSL